MTYELEDLCEHVLAQSCNQQDPDFFMIRVAQVRQLLFVFFCKSFIVSMENSKNCVCSGRSGVEKVFHGVIENYCHQLNMTKLDRS